MGGHEDEFRGLYDDLRAADRTQQRSQLLEDAREQGRRQLDALAALREREPVPALRDPDRQRRLDAEQVTRLWRLYALSRVSDYLLELGCPPGEPDRGWTGGRRLAPQELHLHEAFFGGLGLERFTHPDGFSPFHHEIFAVVQDDTLDHAVLEDVLWPGFRFGALLISRAGVRVRAPATLVDERVATTSPLFFTFRRQPRPTRDASQGWGSNSPWRTRFSRFYEDAEGFHLNWDGSVDLGTDPPTPTPGDPPWYAELDEPLDRRRELLLHRCLVRHPPLPIDGRGPTSDRLSLRTSAWPLDPAAIVTDRR